jgi:hypothetical protein
MEPISPAKVHSPRGGGGHRPARDKKNIGTAAAGPVISRNSTREDDMPETESVRFYYVVFWIRFRSGRLAAAQRRRLCARFGLAAGRHGAVALAVDGSAERLYALVGIHPRREPDSAIDGIRNELKRWLSDVQGGADFYWDDAYAAIPLAPEEAAALLDAASAPGIVSADIVPEDGWWEAPAGAGAVPAGARSR